MLEQMKVRLMLMPLFHDAALFCKHNAVICGHSCNRVLMTSYRSRPSGHAYESHTGPYAGTPLLSMPYTTFLVRLGFEMQKTASAFDCLYNS